jgi:DNA invertase Pin-like site-specific DNA recombinase
VKQGASGLGLEAQQEAVRSYCGTGKWKMVDEVTEIESGKRNDRPALAVALTLCRVHGAILIIAKLDRLARNVHFVSGLMESGVEFTAVDFPQANKLTIHILAAVAEHEAKMISERTKAALRAARVRGVRLGSPTARIASQAARGALASAVVRSRAAQSRAADLRPILEAQRVAAVAEGRPAGLRAIAAHLNDRGIPGPRGGRWHGNAVRRVLILPKTQSRASAC